ncbi:hypothetical protein JW964_08680 [candidate division KSB1 bacterium]|nr:hypothetical protein [candidate division KSB1 bacterium]
MKLTNQNFRLYSWLFAAIWSRQPIIIHSHSTPEATLSILENIIPFIPKYRQLIIHGDLPRRFLFASHRPKYIENINFELLCESILTSFEEEKNLRCRPITYFGYDVPEQIFQKILQLLDRGWIATSSLSIDRIENIFQNASPESFRFNDDISITFLKGHPKRMPMEMQILKIFNSRSALTANYHIQKKETEIRYAAETLVQEIEQGKTFQQAEIQELFDLDYQNFMKCLEIIEAEFYLKIDRYITLTSNRIKHVLQKLCTLDGVLYVCALSDGDLTGLLKTRDRIVFPLKFFHSYFPFVRKMVNKLEIGIPDQISVELSHQLRLVILNDSPSNDYKVAFGFFITAETAITPFVKEALQLIKNSN